MLDQRRRATLAEPTRFRPADTMWDVPFVSAGTDRVGSRGKAPGVAGWG